MSQELTALLASCDRSLTVASLYAHEEGATLRIDSRADKAWWLEAYLSIATLEALLAEAKAAQAAGSAR
jgi:hypothetical protein